MASESDVAALHRIRYEIIPMKGVDEQLDHLPSGVVVTVTASPTLGLDATFDLAAKVAARGHAAVPHVSARLVAGTGHLEELIGRAREIGVREVFVVAGDAATPAGPYEGAADLLEELAGRSHPFERIGITGYPESHSFIPDEVTVESMARKAPLAHYIASQICYDPAIIRGWIAAMRARGIVLPVYVGIPGVIDRARLLRVSLRVGLGDSVRYLKSQPEVATRLLTGYQPDELVTGLADLVDDPVAGVAGWHICTFNEVERTERWRQELNLTEGAVR
jgi:methylenetetrahydrofolate reductase (NADPH)